MTEREYDRLQNEGGEGYNPYRQARERREHEADVEWRKTRAGRKDSIYRAIDRKDCSIARECGTYNQAEIDDLRAQLAAIEAEDIAELVAAWPLDITKVRREMWNARVRSGEFDGPERHRAVYQAERQQGWSLNDLRKAVKHHNL